MIYKQLMAWVMGIIKRDSFAWWNFIKDHDLLIPMKDFCSNAMTFLLKDFLVI